MRFRCRGAIDKGDFWAHKGISKKVDKLLAIDKPIGLHCRHADQKGDF